METAQLEVHAPAPPEDGAESAARNRVPKQRPLELPQEAQPVRFDWNYVIPVSGIHLLSLLILVPWYFSWSGVVIAIFGFPIYGMFGITLCYHRILTHRGLGWVARDTRWHMELSDLAAAGARFGLRAVNISEMIYALELC